MSLNNLYGAACSGERVSRFHRIRVLISQMCSLHYGMVMQ